MVNAELSSEKKSCFVICPFGNQKGSAEETAVFEQIRDLYDHVFSVATGICAERNIDIQISDDRGWDRNIEEPETIRGKVAKMIDQCDVVVMVMTNNQPNAYLELGWAMGLWRNPIILLESNCTMPSDISDIVALPYSAVSIDGSDAAHAQEVGKKLAGQIIKRLSMPKKSRPFSHFAETQVAHGKFDVLGRFKDIKPRAWSQQFHEADEEIILAGSAMLKVITMGEFYNADGEREDLPSILLERALKGVKVTIVVQSPNNFTVDHIRKNFLQDNDEDTEITARDEIERSLQKWQTQRLNFERIQQKGELDLAPDGFRVIQLQKRYLPFRASVTEKKMYFTMRFYTQTYNSGVCFVAEPDPHHDDEFNLPIYTQIREELEFLIERNEEASEEAYQDWLDQHGEV